jgi:hypothetical protein
MVYLTTPAVVLLLVNVWEMELPVPLLKPEIVAPDNCAADHVNVVPVTFALRAILVVAPSQIVCEDGVAVATGLGLTVIVTVIGVPAQLLAVGVIV